MRETKKDPNLVEKKNALTGIYGLTAVALASSSSSSLSKDISFVSAISEHETASFQSTVCAEDDIEERHLVTAKLGFLREEMKLWLKEWVWRWRIIEKVRVMGPGEFCRFRERVWKREGFVVE